LKPQWRRLALLALGVGLFLGARLAPAQDDDRAPYRPTPQAVVDRMLELAQVKPDDYVVDLGAGDGRIVLTAAKKFGARGLGVEINQGLVREAQRAAEREGIADRAKFAVQDLYETSLRDVTVLTLYLLPEMNRKLAPRILSEMKPGTRVVAQEFGIQGWEPDIRETVAGNEEWTGWLRERSVYLWIVPAQIAGRWRVERDSALFVLDISQSFQDAKATASSAGGEVEVNVEPVRARTVRFAVSPPAPFAGEYVGTVDGDTLHGEFRSPGGATGTWRAVRSASR